ncbi:MAG: hypothetical protein C0617_15155 [Desulfuromonas sp.]|nr:MAG: hypothetical protein C0617_15155 [Desulfuromonas sp.]
MIDFFSRVLALRGAAEEATPAVLLLAALCFRYMEPIEPNYNLCLVKVSSFFPSEGRVDSRLMVVKVFSDIGTAWAVFWLFNPPFREKFHGCISN